MYDQAHQIKTMDLIVAMQVHEMLHQASNAGAPRDLDPIPEKKDE